MDILIFAAVRVLETMFGIGLVFSTLAIVVGAIDFARTFSEV
jgi:hypothetical protein